MNCDDINKGIFVYLDDEFAEPERLSFEGHVRACLPCRTRLECERALLLGVREKLPVFAAPEGLLERMKERLAQEPYPMESIRLHRRLRPWHMAAAAAFVLSSSLLGWLLYTRDQSSERLLREVVASHRNELPMEVRGSQRQIRQFLEANVPFRVDIPYVDDERVHLLGARLTRVEGREAVLLNYDIDGERFTLLQVAGPDLKPSFGEEEPPTYASQAGYEIATFKRRGVTNSVVGSAPSGVERIVRASYQPASR